MTFRREKKDKGYTTEKLENVISESIPNCKQGCFVRSATEKIRNIIINRVFSKELKEELNKRIESEKELELFLEKANDLYGVLDKKGVFKKITKQWTEVLGWSEEDILGKSPIPFVHKDYIEEVIKLGNIAKLTRDAVSYTCRIHCKNGDYKIIEWTWKYLNYEEDIIVTGEDKTEELRLDSYRKRLEDEIELENLKIEFFTNMSHEFKTPLNIILTTVQVIDKQLDTSNENNTKALKYINGIKQNSYRLLRLVNNLIDITKIDGGFYEIKLGNYNIVSIIEDIVLSVAEYMKNNNRNIVFDTSDEEIILACDPDKIERIVLNLLSNALKYTEENGNIEINISADNNEKVIVSIKNDGAPIPEEDAHNIFNRFKQCDKLMNMRREGSGIGLSLVYSLLEMHGGKIWVNTKIKKGAEFIFEIPINIVSNKVDTEITNKTLNSKIEKCNIEFSDIYSI